MKLHLKLLLTTGLLILLSFGLVEMINQRHSRMHIVEDMKREARAMRHLVMAVRRVYHQQVMAGGLHLHEETLGLLPAVAMPHISREFTELQRDGTSVRSVSDRPHNPQSLADAVEAEAIRFFRENPEATEKLIPFRGGDGHQFYLFASPLRIQEYCLTCHGDREKAPAGIRDKYHNGFGYRPGEVAGILSIKMPVSEIEAKLGHDHQRYSLTHLGGFLLAFLTISLLIRQLVVRRLGRLRVAALVMAEGDYKVRVPVQGRDEIAEVASAFNAMAEAVQSRERGVAEERAFLQTIIDGVVDPIMMIGLDYRVRLMNKAAKALLPPKAGEGEKYCYKVSHHQDHPCSGDEHPCPLEEVRRTGKPVTVVHQHTVGGGEVRIFELVASPIHRPDGSLEGIIEASRDITDRLHIEAKLQENEEHLHFLANFDTLTNLPNRLMFLDRLQHALARSRRGGQPLALLYLDLDRFKNINDSLGYDIGDRLLLEVTHRLRSFVRESDTLARLGGDEFVIVLEQIQEIKHVVLVAQKVMEALAAPVEIDGYRLFATASLGISLFPGDDDEADGLLKCAEAAMYRAKEEGRNTYQFYTTGMNARTRELLLLESSLRQALQNEQLVLHYQPQVDLASGEIIGVEALLRWRHPDLGVIPPGDFIPLAEDTGLILPIGEWVLRQACRQACRWGSEFRRPLRMAVNISARQFRQAEMVEMVERILEETGLDPKLLELEITESIVMQDVERAIEVMRRLNEMGVGIAIDDFGTGYSSLSYLKRFPISRLKVDRSFVRDVPQNQQDATIVASVIALGQSMNLEVIAEGVETEGQVGFLLEKGCRQGQGFHFSTPVTAAEMEGLLSRGQALGSPRPSGRSGKER